MRDEENIKKTNENTTYKKKKQFIIECHSYP